MKYLQLLGLVALAILSSCKERCDPKPGYETHTGCGDFLLYDVYDLPEHDHLYITFKLDKEHVKLTKEYQSFDLSTHEHMGSKLEKFNKVNTNYCNDALLPNIEMINSWQLESGTAEARIEWDCESDVYLVDVIIRYATYKDSSGNEITVDEKAFNNVVVGWFPG